MTLEELSAAALRAVAPFLKEGGEAMASGVGRELWDLIRKPFTSSVECDFIRRLERSPEGAGAHRDVSGRLAFRLEGAPELADEIARLLPAAEEAAKALTDGGKDA